MTTWTSGYDMLTEAKCVRVRFVVAVGLVDDVHVASQATLTNVPDDEDLTVSFGIQNGAAAAKSMTLDYVIASIER